MSPKIKFIPIKDPFLFKTKIDKNEGQEEFTQTIVLSSIPCNLNEVCSFREFAHQVMLKEKIPLVLREPFFRQLKEFVEDKLDEWEDEQFSTESQEHHQQTPEKDDHSTDKFSRFSSVLKAVNLEKRQNQSSASSGSFWEEYHRVIHSGFLTEALVTLEYSFSRSVNDLLKERDASMNDLRDHQTKEMDDMMKRLTLAEGSTFYATEEDVNKLSVTHFAELDDYKKIWDLKIRELKETQKKEFQEWICKVCQDLDQEQESRGNNRTSQSWSDREESLDHEIQKDLESFNAIARHDSRQENHSVSSVLTLDESFTINLGAQLKTTHNLRLLSSHPLDLLRETNTDPDTSLPTPQRIQTMMSLYSSHLSGMVLLVDNRVNSYSGMKKDFALLVEESNDFHFPSLEDQLEEVRKELPTGSQFLKTGDVYITKHSNLSQVHVVYHLVSDESVMSPEVSSRHAILMGLRNILKTSYLSEVTTICLPLLLTHDLSEQMTIPWCLRRAELVFKCVKGFMIEMASLTSGQEATNRTVIFLLPNGIQDQLFHSIASMLPTIFRLSNPLVLLESAPTSSQRNDSRNSNVSST